MTRNLDLRNSTPERDISRQQARRVQKPTASHQHFYPGQNNINFKDYQTVNSDRPVTVTRQRQ